MGWERMPPPHPTLSPKGARAFPFFLSPLPVGEGWVRALFPSLRVPREGGDPDPFTQVVSGPLTLAFSNTAVS